MHVQHGHTLGRWRTGQFRRSAARPRRRVLKAALGGSLALMLLPLLGAVPAQAAAGQVTEFTLPQGSINNGSPMALGADGNLYFGGSEGASGQAMIGKITPAGQITQFAVPNTTEDQVGLVAAGPDGNVWFIDGGSTILGRITPAGQMTTFSIPAFNGMRIVTEGLAAGGGSLWFTANAVKGRGFAASLAGRIDPATGAVTEFAIPSGPVGAPQPGPPTAGSDGNIWFPEGNLPGITRVTTH